MCNAFSSKVDVLNKEYVLIESTGSYSAVQRQLDTHTQVAGSSHEDDVNMGMQVPVGIFPVLSKACV